MPRACRDERANRLSLGLRHIIGLSRFGQREILERDGFIGPLVDNGNHGAKGGQTNVLLRGLGEGFGYRAGTACIRSTSTIRRKACSSSVS